MSVARCPRHEASAFRALADAICDDDLDRAIALGLLAFDPGAHRCDDCRKTIDAILTARDGRLRALAARERFRAREARLAARAEARARRRADALAAPRAPATPALPPAAAAALARAMAKAAAKRSG